MMLSPLSATILLIDDNPADLAVLTHALTAHGLRILVAQRGESGIAIARHVQPDLILLDVQLPGIDGFATCRELCADPTTQSIPVLFMTVRVEAADKLKGFRAGAVDYITKPFEEAEVLARVKTHLRLRHLAQSLETQNGQLQSAQASLRTANEELERRVLERTAELVRANQNLEAQIAERQRAEAALVVERNRLRTLIDNLPDLIYVKDTAGRFVVANAAMIAYLGASTEEELQGRADIDIFPGDVARQHYADEQAILQTGKPLVNREELSVEGGSGPQKWWLTTKVPVRDMRGEITGLVGVKRDITLYKRLEAQLLQAQKMEGIGRLAGGIAHDFNNLLTVISGHIDLICDTLSPDAPLYSDLQVMRDAADRATTLVRQILIFARKQLLSPQILDLSALVHNLHRLLLRLIGEDVELVVLSAPDIWSVKADTSQIEQVLVNLAVNARDAMPDGGKLTIEIANVVLDEGYAQEHVDVSPGHYVLLAVSDTGTGMSPELIAQVFEPFFTTKELGKGTGLGLATCYGIVKQHGGHIWVYSEVGQGSTFKVYLPAIRGEDDKLRETAQGADAADDSSGGETVLLVEDEEAVRRLAGRVLRQIGYMVLEASDGADALRVAAAHGSGIDLLLTDVVLPQLGGTLLADQLRKADPHLKVLFMSGYTDRTIVHHSLLDQDAAFIQKPFTPALLKRKVRHVLTMR
jgi:two-component system cell cycle sensor histidine kinase/response regulator CckA